MRLRHFVFLKIVVVPIHTSLIYASAPNSTPRLYFIRFRTSILLQEAITGKMRAPSNILWREPTARESARISKIQSQFWNASESPDGSPYWFTRGNELGLGGYIRHRVPSSLLWWPLNSRIHLTEEIEPQAISGHTSDAMGCNHHKT